MNHPDELAAEREAALAQHREGALDVAEAEYRRILAHQPFDAETHHLLGVLQGQRGDSLEAERLIRKAIQLDGTVSKYYGNLGVTLQDLGRDEEALGVLQKAVELDPNSPEALNDLGGCLNKTDRFSDAVITLGRALEFAPTYVAARVNLGVALQKDQRLSDALREYEEVLRLDPDCAEAHSNRGSVLLALGDSDAAIAAHEAALSLDPDLVAGYCNLGAARLQRGEFAVAVEAYQTAVHLAPVDPQACNDLGCALRNLGKHEAAIRAFQQALELEPQYPEALTNVGNALQELGRFTEAVTAYRRALAIRPDDPAIHAYLAEAKTFVPGDNDFEHMLRLAQDRHLPQAAQGQLEFALAKACEDMGTFDEAYSHLAEANAAMRSSFDYDVSRDERLMIRIADVFNKRMVKRIDGYGTASDRPIFIVGMPRSGTSLLEQILSSHPDVFGAGELPDFQRAVLEMVIGKYPDGLADISPRKIAALAERYIDVLSERNSSAPRITDKLPANFLYVGLIYAAFPQAHVIHCVRDPLDTCLSCYRKAFASAHGFAYDLEELGRYYRAYAGLMTHWQRLYPGRLFELRYETLVSEAEPTIRQLIQYCGLEWDEACLRFYETERPVLTASSAQVRRPLFTDSIGAWRRYADYLDPLRAALEGESATGHS